MLERLTLLRGLWRFWIASSVIWVASVYLESVYSIFSQAGLALRALGPPAAILAVGCLAIWVSRGFIKAPPQPLTPAEKLIALDEEKSWPRAITEPPAQHATGYWGAVRAQTAKRHVTLRLIDKGGGKGVDA